MSSVDAVFVAVRPGAVPISTLRLQLGWLIYSCLSETFQQITVLETVPDLSKSAARSKR